MLTHGEVLQYVGKYALIMVRIQLYVLYVAVGRPLLFSIVAAEEREGNLHPHN